MVRQYITKFTLGAVASIVALSSAGCRSLNPGFLSDEQLAEAGTTYGDLGQGEGADTGANAEHSTGLDQASSMGQSTGTGSAGLDTPQAQTQDSSVDSTSSEASSPKTTPETLEYGEFCGDGVELCYPVYETNKTAWETTDQGPSNNPLLLTKPAGLTGGASDTVQPLVSSVWCKNGGFGNSERAHAFAGGDWGVDLWVSQDRWNKGGWSYVELDDVFALRRRLDGKLECLAKLSSGLQSVTLDIGEPSPGLHHVECSFHAGELELRFDAQRVNNVPTEQGAKAMPTDATLSVCRGKTLVKDTTLLGRVAMLRVWSDVARMRTVTKFERGHVCEEVGIC